MSKENENSIFIGARTLEKAEVKIIVPTYDAIINRVEDIRREASNRSNNQGDEHKKKYNNTITLFGGRGTGKTSTMYTIREELNKNTKNILLDIIEPDNIGQEGKLIGCILGLFEDEIKKFQKEIKNRKPQGLSNEIKKDFFEDCRFKENNQLKQAYNDVLEYYCYSEKDYKKLLTCNYNDMNSYIKKSSYIFNADIKFEKKFKEFIDQFIKYKKNFNCNEKDVDNKTDEPLIFIFIDDVDLNTNKCQEIIEAILKYASHSNIICFITGDYNIFTEEFIISLLKQENLKEANLWPSIKINNEKTILQSKQELVHEYMKKVFPTAYRHYVNTWDLSLIPKYSFGLEGNEKRADLFELLSKISEYKSIENIFGDYSEDESKITYNLPAYNIFDKTSRGLVNVYYSLWNIKDNLKNYEEQEYFINIKSFIENIIDSSSLLVKYSQEIKKKYILWGANEKQSKIDFEQLQNLFEDKENPESISKDINSVEIKYSLFYICYYISILLPDIQWLKEKRKNVLKRAMLELVSNPQLNGYEISIECDNNIKQYLSSNSDNYIDSYNYYNYRYNIYFRGFICEILAESKLYFGQRFYNNIVNSKLLGYEVFNDNYKISEEKYNSLYIAFYKSLYNDTTTDTDILMDFYENKRLKKYMEFLEIKSNEDKQLNYIEFIFKEFFEGFNEKVDEQINNILKENSDRVLLNKIKEKFLSLLKLEVIKINNYRLIIDNNFTKYINDIINQYKENILGNINSLYEDKKELLNNAETDSEKKDLEKEFKKFKKFKILANSIYKVHENQNGEQKKKFYEDTKITNGITNMIIEVFGHEMADIFLCSINLADKFSTSFPTSGKEERFQFDLHNHEIEIKRNNFLNSYSGVTYTKADEVKDTIGDIIGNEESGEIIECLNIVKYYELKDKLDKFYNSTALYSKEEAKELIDALDNNIKIKMNNNQIFEENEKWVMQAYSLFIQRAKPEAIYLSELEKAKSYLKELLPKTREKQEAKEKEYLEKLGIEDDYEL